MPEQRPTNAGLGDGVEAGRLPFIVGVVRLALASRAVMCFCPVLDRAGERPLCHGDVLLEVTNSTEDSRR